MTSLSPQELDRMLASLSPEQIREQAQDRLDEEGRRVLAEEEAELAEVEQLLEESGRELREKLPPLPVIPWPEIPSPPPASWWRHKTPVPHWALLPAAVLIVVLVVLQTAVNLSEKNDPEDHLPDLTRGTASHPEALRPLDDRLYNALMAHGIALIHTEQELHEQERWREAFADFLHAHELKPEKREPLEYLIRAAKKLEEHQAVRKFTERLHALEER